MAQIVFFASIREKLSCSELSYSIEAETRVSDLIDSLAKEKGDDWRQILTAENNRVAVNQELITEDVVLKDSDEIAFFPPVTGG